MIKNANFRVVKMCKSYTNWGRDRAADYRRKSTAP